jgi:hypothetical protein
MLGIAGIVMMEPSLPQSQYILLYSMPLADQQWMQRKIELMVMSIQEEMFSG